MSKNENNKKENETKENDTKDNEKENEKIPNSLIIYIKTRLPNFYKLTYEPFMTVPKNKSHTVYFDPLVKYYEWPVKNLPYGAPKDALYTQFFEAAEFDSMINRILSDFRYMQKPKTLKQSVDEHIIDNNIQITLKNLFKPNNLFYINNKPYTIIDSHWKDMDWQIDKKPIEKLLVQFSNLSTKELEEQAKKEEDDIPEVLRQGNISSSNLTSEENASAVATGLQKKVDISTSNSIVNESEITGETDSFINQDKLPGVSEDMKRLYSEYLRKNNPVNYSDNTDLARDPLTLSLLIDPSQLLNFINLNKKNTIVELYSAHINAKINLHNADKEYLNACTELAIYKTTFDSQVTDITKIVKLNKMDDAEKIKKNSIIQEITLLKINYMKIIFRIADAIMAIYTQQHSYFVATKLLLEGLKNDYINIIKYYEKPELAIKCIEYDISVMNSLIAPDPEDIYSKTFFSNYDAFKIFYEKTLYANKDAILTPNINFRDEEYYFNDIIILSIEKQQYEIYNFKMFLFYSYNQFSIWVLLFKSIQIFAKFIGNEATQFLENSETTLATYNKAFPEAQQREFINRIKAYGIRSSYNKKSKAFDWFLVKEDGSKCIEHNQLDTDNSSQQLNQKKSFRLMEDEMHERLYISSVKSQVQAYDAVVIYIYLLEVVCLRQNRTYVAEENVNQLNLEFSLTLNEYYNTIKDNININIPKSLLWDVSKFSEIDFLEKRKKTNDKYSVIYRERLKSISKSRREMVLNCENIADLINPNLSETGFVNKCQSLLTSNLTDIQEHSFRSSFWLDKTIENYNSEATSDFIYNMNNVVKDAWYDRIIKDREPEEFLDWMVYNNSGINTNESIYASISDSLNGQLDLNGDETNNPYTEDIDNKKRFTINSLKKLVIDSSGISDDSKITPDEIILILQEVLKIKFILFEMFPRANTEIQLGDIVRYKDENNDETGRVVDINKDNTEPLYTLYNGFKLEREIPGSKIQLKKSNLHSYFRINCVFSNDSNNNEMYEDYIYIVLSKQSNDTFLKYRLVKNLSNNDYINISNNIPDYILYFIYNNCIRFADEKIDSFEKFKFIFEGFKQTIENQMRSDQLSKEINENDKNLEKVETEYFKLRRKENKTQEEETQQFILKDRVKELRARLNELNELFNNSNSNSNFIGGALTKPSNEFANALNQYDLLDNLLNRNRNRNRIGKRLPYNVSQNKAKDSKSKLSFYITIELELYPGKSANAFQKSVVKCQSTFERIREAYAEIRGFQYRPSVMAEDYIYSIKKDEKKEKKEEKKDEKKGGKKIKSTNTSTRKIHRY